MLGQARCMCVIGRSSVVLRWFAKVHHKTSMPVNATAFLGKPKAFLLGACTVVGAAVLQTFHCPVPQAQKPEYWGVPLMPWIPSISIFLNMFLLGSLDKPSYIRFGIFSVFVGIVYLLYSVHASFDAEEDGSLGMKIGDGMLQPVEPDYRSLKV
ncbi:Cationic amino acid transporter, C-terminal [Dillenia turbinata]|uniref:Cationic amino acid transporter, C-terminal n=1 Tax=Dillenia turbinata TaxID=194707 RepID=A0AAN8V7M0_9MAGN